MAIVGGSPDSPGGAFVKAAGPGTAVISAVDPATGATSDAEGSATLTVLWPLEKLTMRRTAWRDAWGAARASR